MHIIKHHNQKAYMFLSNEGNLVRAHVVLIVQKNLNGKDGIEQKTYTQLISQQQAQYLAFHKTELIEQGIYITDNCTFEAAVIALSGNIKESEYSKTLTSIPSPYISIFDDAILFSTQKTRGPNK